MVLVPSSLHTETPEKICLFLRHLTETVTVSASLESFCDVEEEQVRGKCKGFQREFMKPLMILFVLSSQDLHLLMYSSQDNQV